MAPNPLITPAPTFPVADLQPRQVAQNSAADPYGLSPWGIISSLLAEQSAAMASVSVYSYNPNAVFSSLFAQQSAALASVSIYSDNPNAFLSSLMAEYSSALASISILNYSYSIPAYTSNAGAAITRTGGGTQATAAGAQNTAAPMQTNGKGAGLSQGAKIGIGVGVTLGVLLLVGLGIFLWCAGKSRGKKKGTTIVQAPVPQQHQAQYQPVPQMSGQGYMMGYSQHGPMPPNMSGQPYPGPGQQYGTYAGAVELEQEYHFGKPGVVEIGDGRGEAAPVGKNGRKNK